jgi:hypothetical protein
MRLVDGSPTQGRLAWLATPAVTQVAGPRRAATPTRRNGIPDHTGCPAGEGTRLSTGSPSQGRRVTTAVNKTAGSGEQQPAPGATATRNTPVAQSEEVATCRRRPGLAEAPSRPSRESLKTPSRAESRVAHKNPESLIP